ncbi:MAG: hypothetical protein BroJett026_14810 [Betaproteobacteria bacterium]|nr:MAG: hypothetical protein BroJett026_14810 [Betaproteobacteria bacterium]
MSGDADAGVARRLAPRWAPDAWTGVCVRVVAAATREDGGARVTTPDHYLAAAWAPAVRGPARWPEAVVIGSPTVTRALDELFRHLPDGAMLFLAARDDVDAALAADILLACDRNLEPYQAQAVAAFARDERERVREAIARRYTDSDSGFERFRARVLGPAR